MHKGHFLGDLLVGRSVMTKYFFQFHFVTDSRVPFCEFVEATTWWPHFTIYVVPMCGNHLHKIHV